MSEKDHATNPPEATTGLRNPPGDDAGATSPLNSAYPKKRSYKRWILLVSLVVLIVGCAFLWRYLSGFESTDDAQVDAHLYPVSARISGYVAEVNVDDNQWVDAGSTLVEIDPKDYEVTLAKAQATLDTSEAAARSLNIDVPISSVDTSSQLKFTSSDIKNAEAAVQAAEKQAAAAHARVLEAQAENVKAQDDYIGIAFLTLGVASLQIVLDKGQEDDWFGSQFILTLAITATVCLLALVVWEWYRKEPIIDVRMFKSFNFAAANLMMFMMGVMLFSTLVLVPEFLQTLLGYTAELAGLVLSASGLILLLMMPIVGRLTSKVQARFLIAAGWVSLAIGLFYSAHQIDLYISFDFAMWLRCAQVVGIGFLFVPITAAGYIGVPAEKGNSVSGIINFMRNIGSSIGTSIVTTMIARRSQYHQQVLVGHMTPDTPAYREALQSLTIRIQHSGLGAVDAHNQAIARFYGLVNQQAHMLSFMDTFWVLGVLCAIMFVLSFFLKKNDPGAGGDVAVG